MAKQAYPPILISRCALNAMLFEVSATPKPGLVDRNNSGAHKDMDFYTFLSSASAIAPYLYIFSELGYKYKPKDPKELFTAAREIGKDAEKDMFNATGNVNTHKGLIFSLGLLCVASGALMALGQNLTAESICHFASLMVKDIFTEDFKSLNINKTPTHGEILYLERGIKGIRGEAVGGFKSALSALAFLKRLCLPVYLLSRHPLQHWFILCPFARIPMSCQGEGKRAFIHA